MNHVFRLSEILEIARKEGKVGVDDLAKRLDVTVQTIRRDLSDLADAGKLERVHGGAILPSSITNIEYDARRRLNHLEKERIASTCAATIPDNSAVFLNIGTTTEAVARALVHHRDLMVVTNNINVANILMENPDCEVLLTGGTLRRSDSGLVGGLAIKTIEQFKFDHAIIGCSALDADGDILDFDIQEVDVSQTIIRQSRQTALVADHSKFERSAPVRISSLEAVDQFFTDRALSGDLAQRCREWRTRVTLPQLDAL